MLFFFIKKLALELEYGLPFLTQAWLFKFFFLNLCLRTEGHLMLGQREKTKQPKKRHYVL